MIAVLLPLPARSPGKRPSGRGLAGHSAVGRQHSIVRHIGDGRGQPHSKEHARFLADRRPARPSATFPDTPESPVRGRADSRSFRIVAPKPPDRQCRGNFRRDRARRPGRAFPVFRGAQRSTHIARDGRLPAVRCDARENRNRAATSANRNRRPTGPHCYDWGVRSSWRGNWTTALTGPANCVRLTGLRLPRNPLAWSGAETPHSAGFEFQ